MACVSMKGALHRIGCKRRLVNYQGLAAKKKKVQSVDDEFPTTPKRDANDIRRKTNVSTC